MQLERLDLALRRRTPWEALDLGLVMLRRWRGPVLRAWFATYVAGALAILLVLWQWPVAAALVVWWLKPLADRILLKVFAEAAFGAPPTVREIWRAIPGLLRHSGLLAGLTLRRFNMNRSFDLPLWQLEGQRGKAGRARLRILGRKTTSYAFWLTFVCLHFVVIFEFGLLALVDIITPSGAPPAFDWAQFFSGEQEDWQAFAMTMAWLAAESIVEPFYVAAGFSLYLNRRSELEGWDIEVAFRRMAERQPPAAGGPALGGAATIVLLAGSLACLLAVPADARADEATDPPPAAAAPAASSTPAPAKRPDGMVRRTAETVLADPVFGHRSDEWTWRSRRREEEPESMPWWARKLLRFAELLASGTRWLIYALVALAAAALLVLMYRYRHLALGRRSGPPRPPDMLFGLDLRPDSLPADVAGAALAEIDAGRYAAALSLLYRGTLVSLIRRQHIEFRAGDTEDICLRRVAGRIDAQAASYFAQLLDAWKRTAYAETPPDAASARELCRCWAQHFATPDEAA